MNAIKATIITKLGTFTGHLQHTDGSTDMGDEVHSVMEEVQLSANSLRSLTIVEPDGTEVTFTQEALDCAVIKLKVEEL